LYNWTDYQIIKHIAETLAWEDFVGQPDVIGTEGLLSQFLSEGVEYLPSFILWGPPGLF